jgi:hypothetical protein
MPRIFCTLIGFTLLFQSCQTDPASGTDANQGGEARGTIRILSEPEVIGRYERADPQFIADTLYAGLQAIEDNRLLEPIDDNAHGRFMRVLAYEPNNKIALEGLQEIVVRYLRLSEEAGRRGLFREAATLLDRAKFVDDEHPDIINVSKALQEEMDSGDLFFELNQQEFASRSESAQETLADIARQAQLHSAFFLIIATNDDLARWMFSVMRDSVAGYRLRGNIELANRTSVRLRMPADEQEN